MKYLIGALALLVAQSASALVISAKLVGFEATPHTVSGVATGGGRGTFEFISSDAVAAGELSMVDDLFNGGFQAICLEPDSQVSTQTSYHFLVTDLANAPTSPLSNGSMGVVRETIIEKLLGRAGLTSVESMSLAQVGALTAVTYEAGYESLVNPMNLVAGTTVISGANVAQGISLLNSADPILYDVDAIALLNIGETATLRTRTVYEGQDFAVFSATPVDAPATMALLGLGLLGLSRFMKREEA